MKDFNRTIKGIGDEIKGLKKMKKVMEGFPQHAIIKFNNGRGALCCNKCHRVLREDFNPREIVDKKYFCKDFGKDCYNALVP